jgi:RND family efflux transporter MFP subunit
MNGPQTVDTHTPVTPEADRPAPAPSRWTRRLALVGGALVVLALAGGLVAGTLPRLRRTQELDAAAAQAASAPPRVTVTTVRRDTADAERVLPGTSLPLLEAAMFARATGYIKERRVDIGDRVQEGQLLAVISAPDIDDQLAQAQANLAQARATLALNQANAELARVVMERSQRIKTADPAAVPVEELQRQRAMVDTTWASVETARASIKVNEAMVQRFTDLQGFEKIIAPFKGVITARNIDPGDLVSADSTARELFHLMRTDVLRVFVDVPQVFATGIRVGQGAAVYRREEPGKQYPGKVTRTADALNPATRTLRTEVDVPNPDDALRPGMYLQVKFHFRREVYPIRVPAAALVIGSGPPQVGVLDARHSVRYRTVELGRDYGAEVEVLSGLNDGDTVVVHPGDALPEGTVVDPVALPT